MENCEEVVSELETTSYHHVFAIRQSDRTYLLAAIKYQDMALWVDDICQLLEFQDNANNGCKYIHMYLCVQVNLAPRNWISQSSTNYVRQIQ